MRNIPNILLSHDNPGHLLMASRVGVLYVCFGWCLCGAGCCLLWVYDPDCSFTGGKGWAGVMYTLLSTLCGLDCPKFFTPITCPYANFSSLVTCTVAGAPSLAIDLGFCVLRGVFLYTLLWYLRRYKDIGGMATRDKR